MVFWINMTESVVSNCSLSPPVNFPFTATDVQKQSVGEGFFFDDFRPKLHCITERKQNEHETVLVFLFSLVCNKKPVQPESAQIATKLVVGSEE